MSRLSLPKIALICFVLVGCAEPESSSVPPVMDAMGDMRQVARKHFDRPEAVQKAMEKAKEESANAAPPPLGVPSTGRYVVEFDTTAGKFQVEVNREWAPFGADRFYKLVKAEFFDGAGFFRVMPGFMVQWGLAADPLKNRNWSATIPDEPVLKSNKRGYITFAKTQMPNSRSSQVFINFADNANLDAQGFSPFGKVIAGMDSVDGICSEYGQTPDQGMIRMGGSEYLESKYPKLDYINSTSFVIDDLPQESDEPVTEERTPEGPESSEAATESPADAK